MEVGYQVGQVVLRGSVEPQQQWRDHLEQFRAARDAGFDTYCWAHHYLIHPFQHFQAFPVLARLAAEPGEMKLATSVLLLPLLNPVDVAEQVAAWTTSVKDASSSGWVWATGPRSARPLAPVCLNGGPATRRPWS